MFILFGLLGSFVDSHLAFLFLACFLMAGWGVSCLQIFLHTCSTSTLREITIVLFSLIYGTTKFNLVLGDFSGLAFYDLIFSVVTCKSMSYLVMN